MSCHQAEPAAGIEGGRRDPGPLARMNGLARPKEEQGKEPVKTGRSSAGPAAKPPKGAARKAWALDPAGDNYSRWLNVMVAPVMYSWIILICRSCFPELQQKYLVLWLTLDYFCDLLYLVDIGVHFHTGQ